ncbi:MAG: hypothetical protein HYU28_00485 [Actinobacteria bacterium]|nr:hypothetical protein [Actinomycetota bacterium]
MNEQRRVDRFLEPGYLEGLGARSDEELREMRRECSEVETEFSYLRRLAQARISILRAEHDRRERGAPLSELIDHEEAQRVPAGPGAPRRRRHAGEAAYARRRRTR